MSMLTAEEKSFFASVARGAAQLSKCGGNEGAVLVKGRRILSYGYTREIVGGDEKSSKQYTISGVYDALFGSRDLDLRGSALFCTRFPALDEMKLIVSAGVENVYFFGNVSDPETVKFANSLAKASISLELVRLET